MAPDVAAAGAPGADSLQPKNFYDRHRVHCTCDERLQASRLSGHTWNIITNKDDHEVYLREIRNSDHFVDEKGNATSHWIQQKKRADVDHARVSDNIGRVMTCPGTAGKEAAHLRARQHKQLCQAMDPSDFGAYSARRSASQAPPTPRRGGALDRTAPSQERSRDVPPKPTPRAVDRGQWTARRGEQRAERRPPPEQDMYRTVDQLRVESHADVVGQSFATALQSARTAGASALSGAVTTRSQFVARQDQPARAGASLTRNSMERVEAGDSREISSWPIRRDKLQRGDAYYVKPMAHSGSSSVKYDIVSNERRQFWY
mmetsp:Transcript_6152/g.19366  ORF Transcript_6152/g.19366 Transcript_6152/m.19366 type:complete len:317 (+) Transcript_6152:52-1002(+)